MATHLADFLKRREVGTFAATFPTPLPEESYCDNWIAEHGLRLLRGAPADRPWHLVVNFAGPHEPMDITSRMDGLYPDAEFPQPNRSTEFSPGKHAEVEARGELERTLVVFTSDHGEMLGDHNLWMKRLPQQGSVGIPLVIAGPGVRSGAMTDSLVSLMDLAATFLDYAGVPVPQSMDSRTLRPLLDGSSADHREFLLSGLDPWRCITDGRLKLVRGYAGGRAPGGSGLAAYPAGDAGTEPMLFDIQADPFENDNLAGRAHSDVERLTTAMHRLLGIA